MKFFMYLLIAIVAITAGEASAQFRIENRNEGVRYINPGTTRSVISFFIDINVDQRENPFQLREFTVELHRPWGAEPDFDLEDEEVVLNNENNFWAGFYDNHGDHDRGWTNHFVLSDFEAVNGAHSGLRFRVRALEENYFNLPNEGSSWFVESYFNIQSPLGSSYEFSAAFDDHSFWDVNAGEWVDIPEEQPTINGPVIYVVENSIWLKGGPLSPNPYQLNLGVVSGLTYGGLQFEIRTNPALPLIEVVTQVEGFTVDFEENPDDDHSTMVLMYPNEPGITIPPSAQTILVLTFGGAENLNPRDLVSFSIDHYWVVDDGGNNLGAFSTEEIQQVRGMLADPNLDWLVNISDLIEVIRMVHWGNFWEGSFEFWACNLIPDDEINVRDMARMISLILGRDNQGAPPEAGPFTGINRDDADEFEWSFTNDQPIWLLQVDVRGDLEQYPALLNPNRCQEMSLSQSWHGPEEGNFRRLIIWSINGRIPTGDGVLFEIPDYDGEVELSEPIIVYRQPNGIGDNQVIEPKAFLLNPAYPNPFNSTTKISFSLLQAGAMNLNVYDIEGRKVRQLISGFTPAGANTIKFNGEGLPTGAYFLRLQTPNGEQRLQKVILGK